MQYQPKLKPLARELRSHQTEAELRLWSCLRGKQLLGVQFYRQRPLLNYIVDFYCHAAKLVVECDGGYHYQAEQQVQDQFRDEVLASVGIQVLRFDNRQILHKTASVLAEITRHLAERMK